MKEIIGKACENCKHMVLKHYINKNTDRVVKELMGLKPKTMKPYCELRKKFVERYNLCSSYESIIENKEIDK